MISYMKSEWYRLTKEKSYWIFIIIFTALAVAASIILYIANAASPESDRFPYANTRFYLMNISTSMVIPFFFLYQISQIVVGDEIKHHTMKNSVAFGVSRATIYFGKWIVSIIGLLVIAVISIGISLIAGCLLLENSGSSYIIEFVWAVIGVVPLMIAGLTTYHLLYFISPSANYAIMIFTGIHFLPYVIGRYLGGKIAVLGWIYQHTPMYLLINSKVNEDRHLLMSGNSVSGMSTSWIVGTIVTIVFLTLGYIKFKKMEIK